MDVSTGEIRALREISEEELKTGKWHEIPSAFEEAFRKRRLSSQEDRISALKSAGRKAKRIAKRTARRRNR